jgi:hypothetical protein
MSNGLTQICSDGGHKIGGLWQNQEKHGSSLTIITWREESTRNPPPLDTVLRVSLQVTLARNRLRGHVPRRKCVLANIMESRPST